MKTIMKRHGRAYVGAIAVVLFTGLLWSTARPARQIGCVVPDEQASAIRGGCLNYTQVTCSTGVCVGSYYKYVDADGWVTPQGQGFCGGTLQGGCSDCAATVGSCTGG